jgi:hypothetical protein
VPTFLRPNTPTPPLLSRRPGAPAAASESEAPLAFPAGHWQSAITDSNAKVSPLELSDDDEQSDASFGGSASSSSTSASHMRLRSTWWCGSEIQNILERSGMAPRRTAAATAAAATPDRGAGVGVAPAATSPPSPVPMPVPVPVSAPVPLPARVDIPSISARTVAKLIFFSVAMLAGPVGAFFYVRETWWQGPSRLYA